MNRPLVTVIVISYNSSAYIIETLESVKNQTYQKIELVVTDDGSSDNTVVISKVWMRKNQDRFINCILTTTEENTGTPANCNRGLKKANGEWIKYIAADDQLLNTCIEENITFCNENYPLSVVFSEALKMDEAGNDLKNETFYYKSEKNNWKHDFFLKSSSEQLKMYALKPLFLVTPTMFINKNELLEVGGFDEHLSVFEDIPMFFKLLKRGTQFRHLDKPTVRYRISDQSISKRKDKDLDLKRLRELKYIYETYRKPQLKSLTFASIMAKVEAWLDYTFVLKLKLPGARFIKMLLPNYY